MSPRARPFPIDPQSIAASHLAHFVGLVANRRILEEMRRAGFGDVRESHGFLIQHLLGGPRSVGELAQLLGVTQQAVSKSVAELTRGGYLESLPGDDARVRLVRLSARGHRCVLLSRRLRDELEQRLERKLGAACLKETRRVLAAMLAELGGLEAVKARRVKSADAD